MLFKGEGSQFNTEETIFLTSMTALFSYQKLNIGPFHGWNSMLTKAWGIHASSASIKFYNFIDAELSIKRKTRSDKGSSVFNCEKKRKATFTAFNLFKKQKSNVEFRKSFARISEERKQFIANEEREGVIPITVNPERVEETLQGQVVVVHGIGALKYKEPNFLATLGTYTISKEAINLLKEHMYIELMDDELITACANEIEGDDV